MRIRGNRIWGKGGGFGSGIEGDSEYGSGLKGNSGMSLRNDYVCGQRDMLNYAMRKC